MSKVIGLTGGIGSGKTTVANMFLELGVPVYIADIEAKKLMNKSKVIKRKLIKLFGEEAYIDGILNKHFIAQKIFNNKNLLEKMNAIVHPKVASHFKRWLAKQEAPYVIKEAAILFENNSYLNHDAIILVVANEEVRIQRVIKRDNSTKEKVKAIISNQWSDEKKKPLSQFVINNTTLLKTRKEVEKTHKKILNTICAK
ncbi:dephospho-CoA kinase [Pontimicrobium aquaticum]|uniref:Dephospho-CoA kinase n=1 Tax=Pontimicrobium aquaticum TaxID=2565367 RepID=A0A4U0EW09_9FLAO|nr:dephospho-CoA kinase [Pontimicrobium aquaticum]TJY36073.1 dephospho-CoA kinase [Pontimicrobium aquaticum]